MKAKNSLGEGVKDETGSSRGGRLRGNPSQSAIKPQKWRRGITRPLEVIGGGKRVGQWNGLTGRGPMKKLFGPLTAEEKVRGNASSHLPETSWLHTTGGTTRGGATQKSASKAHSEDTTLGLTGQTRGKGPEKEETVGKHESQLARQGAIDRIYEREEITLPGHRGRERGFICWHTEALW